MPSRGSVSYRNILLSMYAAAFLLVVTPIVDFVQNVWPLQPSVLPWRFGAVGLFSGFLLTPLLGMLLFLFAAVQLSHRAVLRIFAFLSLFVSLVLLVLLALFILDVFQMRGTVKPEMKTAFDTTGIKAVVKYLTGALVFGWIGLATLWDLGSTPRPVVASDKATAAEKGLIVGR